MTFSIDLAKVKPLLQCENYKVKVKLGSRGPRTSIFCEDGGATVVFNKRKITKQVTLDEEIEFIRGQI